MSKILIIDDSPPIVTLIKEMVTLIGHTVDTALSGPEGIDKLRQSDHELILLDIMMPEMNGWQVHEEVRRFTTIPVIFITASDTATNRKRAADLGELLLSKEVSLVELKQHIEDVINTYKISH
ncbi:MAG: response regulator [Anaerolineales bacterium]|nr:response regulator [Anaerolineales bacterium]